MNKSFQDKLAENGYIVCGAFNHDEILEMHNEISMFVNKRICDLGVCSSSTKNTLEILERTNPQRAHDISRTIMKEENLFPSILKFIAKHQQLFNSIAAVSSTSLFRLRCAFPTANNFHHGWHQDYLETPNEVPMKAIVWIPLRTVAPGSGNLILLERGHRKRYEHTITDQFGRRFIDSDELQGTTIDITVDLGEMLIMHPRMPHRTGQNLTSTIRWALVVWLYEA